MLEDVVVLVFAGAIVGAGAAIDAVRHAVGIAVDEFFAGPPTAAGSRNGLRIIRT